MVYTIVGIERLVLKVKYFTGGECSYFYCDYSSSTFLNLIGIVYFQENYLIQLEIFFYN